MKVDPKLFSTVVLNFAGLLINDTYDVIGNETPVEKRLGGPLFRITLQRSDIGYRNGNPSGTYRSPIVVGNLSAPEDMEDDLKPSIGEVSGPDSHSDKLCGRRCRRPVTSLQTVVIRRGPLSKARCSLLV